MAEYLPVPEGSGMSGSLDPKLEVSSPLLCLAHVLLTASSGPSFHSSEQSAECGVGETHRVLGDLVVMPPETEGVPRPLEAAGSRKSTQILSHLHK